MSKSNLSSFSRLLAINIALCIRGTNAIAQRIAYDVLLPDQFAMVRGHDTIYLDRLNVLDIANTFGAPGSLVVFDQDHPMGEAFSEIHYGDCAIVFSEGGCGGTRFLHFQSDDIQIVHFGRGFEVGDSMDALSQSFPHAFYDRSISDEDGRTHIWAPFFVKHERSLIMYDCGMSIAVDTASKKIVEIKLDFG